MLVLLLKKIFTGVTRCAYEGRIYLHTIQYNTMASEGAGDADLESKLILATSVKAGNRKSGGIIHCFFLVKSCQLEVRGFDIKTEF